MNISNLKGYTSNITNNENKLKQTQQKAERTEKQEELLKACQDFEAIFTNIMLKEMRKTVGESGLIEKSRATEMFEEMYDEKLSEEISKGSNGIGVAKMLYEQMKNRV